MAGTIPLSMTQQFDIYGQPLAGGQLYLILAGTVSTPQNGFQDLGLTMPLPNPITLDAAGRIPQFFLADGLIKVRLQDKNGVVQLASDGIQVIGPSSGGGGGGGGLAGDPTQLWQTGDLKARYSTGAHPVPPGGTSPGWVRANGLTIGSASASPSATERGNADCQALFQFLWPNTDLTVSSGRGASAAADWGAGKTIALPDYRGYALGALTDMGNTPVSRLSAAYFGSDGTVLGAVGGVEGRILAQAQLPNIVPTFSGSAVELTVSTGWGGNPFGGQIVTGNISGTQLVSSGGGTGAATGSSFGSHNIDSKGPYTPAGTISSINGSVSQTGLITLGPRKLCTFYLKL
jgi:hypothetical protein